MIRLLVVASVVATLLVGCGDEGDEPDAAPTSAAGPRGVTSDEADRLAVSRFRNYQRELVPFEISVPVEEQVLTVTGRADMREHRAVGSAVAADPPAYATFAWNFAAVAVVDTETPATDAELGNVGKVPQAAWQVHSIESGEVLDQVLLVLLNLALDRPENAQLLRQNGAQWQAATVVDGKEVDIMTATPVGEGQTLSYYVDATGNLVRVDVAVGADRPATITFLDGEAAAVPVVTALGPTPDTQPS